MKSIHILIVFIIVAVVQIFVPVNMILDKEDVLTTGKVYKFKTRPIDPADPFRGKYISLDFEAALYYTKDSIWRRGEDVYVYFETDSLGYAKVSQVSREILQYSNKSYVLAKIRWYNNRSKELNIKYPFDRFYMEESKAYEAELAVRENQRDSLLDNVYALVYLKEGKVVLENVLIDDEPIKDYVERRLGSN